MNCPACGHENPDGAKFCNQCAGPLPVFCSKCGTANPAGAKFCNGCATPLTTGSKSLPTKTNEQTHSEIHIRPELIDSSSAPDGERKTVTALFADIKGSMELMEDLDTEEARGIIDPALTIMVDAVRRYDGYIVQSTGDGIFALFGAPVAHEDHPQRALYAALRIQDQIAPLRRQLARGGPRALTDPHRCQCRRASGALYSPRRGQERVHADRPYGQSRSADGGAGESRLDSKSHEALI
jgi:Double zinc ribbon/Adenylate and Guanylate cyclase catalytic domain